MSNTNTINSIVLKRQTLCPKPVTYPLYPAPDLLSILRAANIEDGWKKAGKNAPDAATDILVYLGDNDQHPSSQLKITKKYVKSSFYNGIPYLKQQNCKVNFSRDNVPFFSPGSVSFRDA